jgi:hypothetical protein
MDGKLRRTVGVSLAAWSMGLNSIAAMISAIGLNVICEELHRKTTIRE